ncbi:MAG TPA: cysteine dioxygenase family protein [Solirubrobacteraceae bacterium]|jgi:quercetin dioxygenase-like cupin family protein|nr:cysteine dioxygenase family protein [Solirubrobacteraceae bacterium]
MSAAAQLTRRGRQPAIPPEVLAAHVPPEATNPFQAVPRPRGRDLTAAELEDFARAIAERAELWIGLVKHDRTQRLYEELLSDRHVTAWLICWMDEQDTGFHDHDVSAGAVAVVSGTVREERLAVGAAPRERRVAVGSSFSFEPADIHRVTHAGTDPAVTLHVYSPPLRRMGAYAIAEDGVLARHTMSYEEELRPLER